MQKTHVSNTVPVYGKLDSQLTELFTSVTYLMGYDASTYLMSIHTWNISKVYFFDLGLKIIIR